jgi:proliferating cell nuclear antigen PCNA
MKIQISNLVKAETFSAIFQNMKLFAENINIVFSDDKMFVQAIDASRVSVLELNLPATWFDAFEETNMTIGVNSIIFFKILSTRDKCQNIEIQCTDTMDKLLIKFVSDNKTIFDKTFEMPLIDLDAEIMSIHDIDYQAEFTLPSTNFYNLVNQLKMFGDTMDIECSEDKIVLFSDAQDCGKMSANISIDELTSFSIEEGEKIQMSFSLVHLHSIAQFHKLAKEVELSFKREYPIKIIYNLGGNNDSSTQNENGGVLPTIRFYLAPKIPDTDD